MSDSESDARSDARSDAGSDLGSEEGSEEGSETGSEAGSDEEVRRKSLLIGINYVGQESELNGCHADVDRMAEYIATRGYGDGEEEQVIMTDKDDVDEDSPYYPTGDNILAAMEWLVSEPGCTLFFHYSGHGGQMEDFDGNRETGIDDTLVPVDADDEGQISSTVLHEVLVTKMARNCTLFIIMDCCHSGSAVELPYVYRTNEEGEIALLDNLRMGVELVGQARKLMKGGFKMKKVGEAKELLAGATDFFRGLKHLKEQEEEGLEEGEFVGQYGSEKKQVTMFSGCRDDQTSTDAEIEGEPSGAMTWAFLKVMEDNENISYADALKEIRQLLVDSEYEQVPQLSCGLEWGLAEMELML